MKNCLLCSNCNSENESGIYNSYSCNKRELENDKRFPYKNTKCKDYKNETDFISLCVKDLSKKLWNTIDWEIKE